MSNLKKRFNDNSRNKFQSCQTEAFLSLLPKKCGKVLEIGCGRGYFSYVGAKNKRFVNLYGCDLFNNLEVEGINPHVKKLIYKQIKGKKLPFKNNFFDLVFSMDVIEHISDDINFINEHLRVCRHGGEIIIGTPNLFRPANLLLAAIGRLKFPRVIARDYYGDAVHIREYSIKNLLEKIAVRDVQVFPCWLGLLPLNLGIRKFPSILSNFCQFWFVKFTKL